MKRRLSRQQTILVLTIVGFVALAVLAVALDWKQVSQVVGKSNLVLTLAALAFTTVSYVCLSAGYVIINRAFGIPVGWGHLFQVGLVSSALNNVLAFLGAAGHSLRLALVRQPSGRGGEVLAASLFHSYVNNVMMFVLMVVGLLIVLASNIVYGGGALSLALITAFLILGLAVATAMLFIARLRYWLIGRFAWLWHLITRKDLMPFMNEFSHALTHGLAALGRRPAMLAVMLVLMLGDWAFAAVALWFCFAALGGAPGVGILLSGFGIGISAGNLSFLPGGLGVQEASMAGVFALLGRSFGQAVLAAILFRVVYDFVPFFLSLSLYGRLLRRLRLR